MEAAEEAPACPQAATCSESEEGSQKLDSCSEPRRAKCVGWQRLPCRYHGAGVAAAPPPTPPPITDQASPCATLPRDPASLLPGLTDEGGDSDLMRIQPMALQWRALSYSVTAGWWRWQRQKTVLAGISGHASPGHLLAVMGPTGGCREAGMNMPQLMQRSAAGRHCNASAFPLHLRAGSGKTSLLNALAGRLPRGGTLTGEVLVNGAPRGPGFRSAAAFVMQASRAGAGEGRQAGTDAAPGRGTPRQPQPPPAHVRCSTHCLAPACPAGRRPLLLDDGARDAALCGGHAPARGPGCCRPAGCGGAHHPPPGPGQGR